MTSLGKEKIVYRDEYSFKEIQEWYDSEAEGYASMYGEQTLQCGYRFHKINQKYAFSKLHDQKELGHALGFGASWGFEFEPICDRLKSITIVEVSDNTVSESIGGITPLYVKPTMEGNLIFEDDTFDLITCFDVLHHIPNVSYVFSELSRVLSSDGYLLIREPIQSMGDWRQKRPGLTPNERGIPRSNFKKMIEENNLRVVSESYFFSMTSYLERSFPSFDFCKSRSYLELDRWISKFLLWNWHYHPQNKLQRICPHSVCYVLRK